MKLELLWIEIEGARIKGEGASEIFALGHVSSRRHQLLDRSLCRLASTGAFRQPQMGPNVTGVICDGLTEGRRRTGQVALPEAGATQGQPLFLNDSHHVHIDTGRVAVFRTRASEFGFNARRMGRFTQFPGVTSLNASSGHNRAVGSPNPRAAFDAHFHLIEPGFVLIGDYEPPRFELADYQAWTQGLAGVGLDVVGGAVVSGSFQGFDQTYLVAALQRLGPSFVGVTQLPPDVDDATLRHLDSLGVRAIRFNLRRGGSAGLEHVSRLGARVHDVVGWHTELYADGATLPELWPHLTSLPRVCIDHLGLRREGRVHVERALEAGFWVKLTGLGRLDFEPEETIARWLELRSDRLLFGTDLPSTRAPRPFELQDVERIASLCTQAQAQQVFLENALELYRPRRVPGTSDAKAASIASSVRPNELES